MFDFFVRIKIWWYTTRANTLAKKSWKKRAVFDKYNNIHISKIYYKWKKFISKIPNDKLSGLLPFDNMNSIFIQEAATLAMPLFNKFVAMGILIDENVIQQIIHNKSGGKDLGLKFLVMKNINPNLINLLDINNRTMIAEKIINNLGDNLDVAKEAITFLKPIRYNTKDIEKTLRQYADDCHELFIRIKFMLDQGADINDLDITYCQCPNVLSLLGYNITDEINKKHHHKHYLDDDNKEYIDMTGRINSNSGGNDMLLLFLRNNSQEVTPTSPRRSRTLDFGSISEEKISNTSLALFI
jgi:hypothetical protein